MKPHWPNPWEDAVYVPVDELVDCIKGIGEVWIDGRGKSFVMTKEKMLERILKDGDPVEAYILPNPADNYPIPSIGFRYGPNGEDYLSPYGDREKVIALYNKYNKVKP